jgi:hypothetical protein
MRRAGGAMSARSKSVSERAGQVEKRSSSPLLAVSSTSRLRPAPAVAPSASGSQLPIMLPSR